MGKAYYQYTLEQLMEHSRIPLVCQEDNGAVFAAMAKEMAQTIQENNARGRRSVFIVPVGPVGQYGYFVDLVNSQGIDLRNVWFFNMDEYLGEDGLWIDSSHALSFRGFMDRQVYGRIRPELVMPPEQRVFPHPRDLEAVGALLAELGGADIAFGGIGINGHVAFNEPEAQVSAEVYLTRPARVLPISPETRTANAIGDLQGALEDMPSHCVTLGMAEIYSAAKIRLGCFRNWHRAVVRRAACGEPTAEFPITLFQGHRDIQIRFTRLVAALGD